MTREHFLNAEFDLSLRPGWSRDAAPGLAAQIRDLALLAVPAAAPGESVVLYEPLPEEFGEWLTGHGLDPPQVSLHPARRPGSELAPFGWNRHAAELDRGSARRARRPSLDVVRRVNDRRFADRVAREVLGETEHVLGTAQSPAGVRRLLVADAGHAGGWVVKARHGNSALANRRVRHAPPDPGEERLLAGLLAADGVVTVERWRPRECDLSVVCEIRRDGGLAGASAHEVVNTAAGAFLGVLLEPADGAALAPWREPLLATAAEVGSELAGAGYFGPVCLDAFVWRDGGHLRLRRLVELNARRPMSAGFARLADRWQGRRTVYGRLVSGRRLRLPAGYAALDAALGDDRFDADRGYGVLPISPLWLGPQRRRPRRAGIAFVAADRLSALAMADRFRRRFGA